MKTIQDQHMMYLSPASFAQGNKKIQPFLQENETLAFDLQSRTLVFTTGEVATGIARFSPTDAHLLLPLLYFSPHYVSDATLTIGYATDLFEYYQYLKGEREAPSIHAAYPIADGIDRLKKKVIVFGITIVRVRNTGYILERLEDYSSQRRRYVRHVVQRYERQYREEVL